MKKFCVRSILAGVLLAAALCLFTGCAAFPHLAQALFGDSPPITLAIFLDPGDPEGTSVSWSPASAPVDSAAVEVNLDGSAPSLTVTLQLRPGSW